MHTSFSHQKEDPNMAKIKEKPSGEGGSRWPAWLGPLLGTRFFVQCDFHAKYSKSECNMFCMDCMDGALCSVCLGCHRGHGIIQIRRSSYHDVIRVAEIQKVLDIAGVQTYIINSARVVFLNERPQPRPGKGVTNTCHVCRRGLLDNFLFCSLGCKVAGTRGGYGYLRKEKELMEEVVRSDSEDSCTTTSEARTLTFAAKAAPPPPAASFRIGAKRRKGIPHRAPLGTDLLLDY